MQEIKKYPPAFATLDESGASGLTILDWFAGRALEGIIAAAPNNYLHDAENMANRAYEIAHAMTNTRQAWQVAEHV